MGWFVGVRLVEGRVGSGNKLWVMEGNGMIKGWRG